MIITRYIEERIERKWVSREAASVRMDLTPNTSPPEHNLSEDGAHSGTGQ